MTITTMLDPASAEAEERFFRHLRFNTLIRGGSVSPHWLRDGSSFWYADGAPNDTVIYKVDSKEARREPLFDVQRARVAITAALGYEPAGRGLPFDKVVLDESEQIAWFEVEGWELSLNLDSYEITSSLTQRSPVERDRATPRRVRPPVVAGWPDVMEAPSPDGRWMAGVTDYNLSVRSTLDGRVSALTDDGIAGHAWDVERAMWSPDSLRLAATKIDTRRLQRFPILHWLKEQEEVEWVPFAKSGGPIEGAELYLVDVLGRNPIRVDTGTDLEQAFRPVAWLPDNSGFLFVCVGRVFKPLSLCRADPVTGACEEILREEIDTFVMHSDVDIVCTFLPERQQFIWRSERDGWAHLYLYDLTGSLLGRLTGGEFPVQRVIHVDEENGWVYFLAQAEKRIYDTHVYRVRLDGSESMRISEEEGQHHATISPSGEYFLDTHSSHIRPPSVDLLTSGGERIMTISKADISGLEGLDTHDPEEFTALADDGETELHGLLFLPPHFDPSRRYPVIDSIYGGPQIAIVPRSYEGGMAGLARAVASDGFIVLMMDGRGTPGRSKAFHDVIYKNWGRYVIPDHVAVLRQISDTRPYMDLSRVGICGGSWGGYNTVRAMLTAPDVYHAGVAGVPVGDIYNHIAQSIEPYMGTPQENREAYEYASCLPLAGNLRGKLMLIGNTSDVNAPFSATVQLANAFMEAGVLYDLVILPEQNHHAQGRAGIYYWKVQRSYFVEHLHP